MEIGWTLCPADLATQGGRIMDFKIPKPLEVEHEELHGELVKAMKMPGRVGEAARTVATFLHQHFVHEEEFALPPLGLLARLAEGKVTPEMRQVLTPSDKLKAELPQMLDEHKAIVRALEKLIVAAEVEGKPEVARFAEKLILHAQTEEEVLYPTAILIGEYVRAQLARRPAVKFAEKWGHQP